MGRRLLRPESDLFRQGVFAVIAFMTPVFVVLYFLTVPDGPWLAVLVTQIFATVAVTLAAYAYFRAGIWIDGEGIIERGFFGLHRHVPVGDVGSIVLAQTFDSSGRNAIPQLFVCDHEGTTVIRMRGQFWSQQSMDAVVEALDVPVLPIDDTVSTDELRTDHPGLLYWFERHPWQTGVAFTLVTAAVGGLAYLIIQLVG
jgi:hypothetical protein